ncbi:DEAD/DEAH box helicase [Undibacterium sp. LX40W]|uniref:DEAD/DEAH box helicase n=1 Tax=Undibacterium nitidum TaxID=2762298 RepID=A0A923HU39_9BURK|nr:MULTISPECIES: DEAD/DEAH box helicase [Undibacterium]MBC3882637.1 DEAD/DEAH box helicase [Undibacterium nitidum]MBC3892918.1 DEAD/DEAH box helicase [Undibacterium sp. LX40W]
MIFSNLDLPTLLQNAIQSAGFTEATPIQASVIPAMLANKDVLACAQTGSGKTAAFCLPLLNAYLQRQAGANKGSRVVQALVLVPTRELATQIGDQLRRFSLGFPHPPKLAVLFGGISINPQMLHLRGGVDIVIATPGRLLDLIDKNALKLDQLSTLVLDEADRMLALGFADELNKVLAFLPTQRQSAFFSATYSSFVAQMAEGMLHEPERFNIETDDGTKPDIQQRAIQVEASQRTQLLKHLYQTQKWSRAMVFVGTKYTADLLATKLRRAHISADAFHGDQTQGKREQVISDFKASRLKILIATDVAARGLDISQLPVVVNYDLPRSADDYVHRIGRTGRAGESGLAINFICADAANEAHFRLIEKRHDLRLEREHIAGFEPAVESIANAERATVSDPNGGIKGKRPSKKDKLRALAAQQTAGQDSDKSK